MATTQITNFAIDLSSLQIVHPKPPDTYLGVAYGMIGGAHTLATQSSSRLALALVSAHVLECTLKAFISRNGDDSKLKKEFEIRHNLEHLWDLARIEGLPISQQLPVWALSLAAIHGHPYHLRYSYGINGLQLPDAEPMVAELQALLDLVQEQVTKNQGTST
ncbi:hypothetical protein [Hydrogenophaga sp. SL48]|uniref:hypothetical protein n=1 Tax=Hydrogenophaga sp. SL48 TaxID=2806347 RepID=UPI001F35C3BE|nr:hypothetical protein [Hydrogenophaga sp. SL48]UJW82708.1 hypothetical protein IM738_08530 [Hydrogenophaga sp. SL48]